MSSNFGRYNPANYSAQKPIDIDTGLGWEYIRIINDSAYLLSISFGNQGTIDFPEMSFEDVLITQTYNGKIAIVPTANIVGGLASALSSLISINAYQPGELAAPQVGRLQTLMGIGTQVASGQTFDAILEVQPSVDCTIFTAQSFALTATGLNLAGVSASNPGYLILGYLDCDGGRQTFKDTRGNQEIASQLFAITVPAGGNTQSFLFAPANWFKALAFYSFGANVSINDLQIKRSQDPSGSYVELLAGGTTSNKIVDVGVFFGPDGMPNLVSQSAGSGFNIQLMLGNTAGAAQNVTMQCYGLVTAYDEAKILVSYEDWNNNIYDLGTITIGQLKTLLLDFLVPIPITNPGQTNFGNIIFTVQSTQLYYNTHYTLDTVIPCIVSSLALG